MTMGDSGCATSTPFAASNCSKSLGLTPLCTPIAANKNHAVTRSASKLLKQKRRLYSAASAEFTELKVSSTPKQSQLAAQTAVKYTLRKRSSVVAFEKTSAAARFAATLFKATPQSVEPNVEVQANADDSERVFDVDDSATAAKPEKNRGKSKNVSKSKPTKKNTVPAASSKAKIHTKDTSRKIIGSAKKPAHRKRASLKKTDVKVKSSQSKKASPDKTDKKIIRPSSKKGSSDETQAKRKRSQSKKAILDETNKKTKRPRSKKESFNETDQKTKRPRSKKESLDETDQKTKRPRSKKESLDETITKIKRPPSKKKSLEVSDVKSKRPSKNASNSKLKKVCNCGAETSILSPKPVARTQNFKSMKLQTFKTFDRMEAPTMKNRNDEDALCVYNRDVGVYRSYFKTEKRECSNQNSGGFLVPIGHKDYLGYTAEMNDQFFKKSQTTERHLLPVAYETFETEDRTNERFKVPIGYPKRVPRNRGFVQEYEDSCSSTNYNQNNYSIFSSTNNTMRSNSVKTFAKETNYKNSGDRYHFSSIDRAPKNNYTVFTSMSNTVRNNAANTLAKETNPKISDERYHFSSIDRVPKNNYTTFSSTSNTMRTNGVSTFPKETNFKNSGNQFSSIDQALKNNAVFSKPKSINDHIRLTQNVCSTSSIMNFVKPINSHLQSTQNITSTSSNLNFVKSKNRVPQTTITSFVRSYNDADIDDLSDYSFENLQPAELKSKFGSSNMCNVNNFRTINNREETNLNNIANNYQNTSFDESSANQESESDQSRSPILGTVKKRKFANDRLNYTDENRESYLHLKINQADCSSLGVGYFKKPIVNHRQNPADMSFSDDDSWIQVKRSPMKF